MGKAAIVNICRGADGGKCRFGLFHDKDFLSKIESVIDKSGWIDFLLSKYGENISRHKAFNVSVGACPNGCTRPHIADIGLIRACVPDINHADCIMCGQCMERCPEKVMFDSDGQVEISRDGCLQCGICVKACPVEAISCSKSGWRVVAGGRLGRHPKLATELEGIFSSDEVLVIIENGLKLWMDNYDLAPRFGLVMDSLGYDKLIKK